MIDNSELIITDDIRDFLRETAKWSKFISLTSLIMMGLALLFVILFGGVFMSEATMLAAPEAAFSGVMIFGYAIVLCFMAIPIYYLYRFSVEIQAALLHDDQNAMSSAFGRLKSHYKFNGIVLAVVMGIYLLTFVGGLLAVWSAGS